MIISFFRQQEECQCQKTTKNYLTVISHEATILKAAAWCLLIPPSPQIPVKQLLEETFGEAEENCFQDFETLLIKKVDIIEFLYLRCVHVQMINVELIPMIKPNRWGKKQNEAQLLLSLV